MDTKPTASARRFKRRRLGQHFLSRRRAVEQVVEAISPLPGQRFLEIGPGRGALTFPLLEAGASVLAVELDGALAASLVERNPKGSALSVLEGDILRLDPTEIALQPFFHGERIRVVGNLPYSIASPTTLRLLESPGRIADWTLMVQREVADRILSPPGSRLFGVLTLLCSARAACARLLDLPPSCFSPPPAVHSTLLHFTPRSPGILPAQDFPLFERVVKAAFSRRRKMIRNTLAAGLGLDAVKGEAALKTAGINPVQRPEQVPLQGYVELSRILKETVGISPTKGWTSLL